mmetsp:Transcript_15469/g.23767  ORF Transcript_15469/g.23767 Transcript_15469/m.23767 type:complete len:197 (-) Transcript_15469:524-1114(-)
MMRNTSPIGWIPLLFIKVFRDGAFVPFLISAVTVAVPVVGFALYFDSWYYSKDLPTFEWTSTGFNFLKVNLLEGLSKYFGVQPVWFYVGAYAPSIFTVAYPAVMFSIYFYTKETWAKGQSPEMMYATIFYVVIFSLIAHKEDRFLLPIIAFCFLALGYTLQRKVKSLGSSLKWFILFSVVIELIVQGVNLTHHKLW